MTIDDPNKAASEEAIRLLPCPFCGTVPDLNVPHTLDCDQGTKWGFVQCCCRGPEVRTGYGPVEEWRDDAIEAWNTRVHPAPEGGSAAGLRSAARQGAEALDSLWAAIGDRLHAKGPLALPYAQKVMTECTEARKRIEAALASPAAEEQKAPEEPTMVCAYCKNVQPVPGVDIRTLRGQVKCAACGKDIISWDTKAEPPAPPSASSDAEIEAASEEAIREALRYVWHEDECKSHENGPGTCNCGSDDAMRKALAALDGFLRPHPAPEGGSAAGLREAFERLVHESKWVRDAYELASDESLIATDFCRRLDEAEKALASPAQPVAAGGEEKGATIAFVSPQLADAIANDPKMAEAMKDLTKAADRALQEQSQRTGGVRDLIEKLPAPASASSDAEIEAAIRNLGDAAYATGFADGEKWPKLPLNTKARRSENIEAALRALVQSKLAAKEAEIRVITDDLAAILDEHGVAKDVFDPFDRVERVCADLVDARTDLAALKKAQGERAVGDEKGEG